MKSNEAKRGRNVGVWLVVPGTSPIGGNARNLLNGGFGTLEDVLTFTGGADRAVVRIGVRDPALYPSQLGNVMPFCGEITQPITTFMESPGTPNNPGAFQVQQTLWAINRGYIDPAGASRAAVAPPGQCFVERLWPWRLAGSCSGRP